MLSRKKKRGPAPTGKGTLVGVRLQPADLSRLDNWIESRNGEPLSRPEAIRRLLHEALRGDPGRTLDERIARSERKIARDVPPGSSLQAGLAKMRKGLAEVENRQLVAKKAAKQKPDHETRPSPASGKKGSGVKDAPITRRALVAAAEKSRGKKKP